MIEDYYKKNSVDFNFDEKLYKSKFPETKDFYQPFCRENGISEKQRLFYHFVTYYKDQNKKDFYYKMKIGLLTIATYKYTDFINRLYQSADDYFMNNHEVTYFLFTDNRSFIPQTKRNFKILHKEHESWPMVTLKRYHTFCNYEQEIMNMDYVYYCDADMLFINKIGDEIIGEKVVTLHPGFYNKPRDQFSYDTNPECKAFIPSDKGEKYYAGGFNGGETKQFLKMSKFIMNNINEDIDNGIIAVWHDESHINHYYNMVESPSIELSPSYCYQEDSDIPFEKRILALNKNHKEYQV